MQLRCKVCQASQPVTTADAEDEDPRTAAIRRTFRAEHIASCGEGSVSLILHSVEATYVDPEIWRHYLAEVAPPSDVTTGADGFFSRTITRDGKSFNVRVCEDCWENIPRYVDFPAGLISPESDGTDTRIAKLRPSTVETDSPLRAAAAEHLWKAVCLPCYLKAFDRVYPATTLPQFNPTVVGDGAPIEPEPPVPAEVLGKVTISRWDREEISA